MTEMLFYRQTADAFEWRCYDGQGNLAEEGQGAESELQAVVSEFAGDIVFVVPGESVLITSASVPTRNPRQLAQAVPYAIEERIATDVEDCFFALGKRNADGEIQVAVVDAELMASWVSLQKSLGFKTRWLVAEHDLVSGDAAAVVDGQRVHLSVSGRQSLTIPARDLPLAVALPAQPLTGLHVQVQEDDESNVRLAVDELNASEIKVDLDTVPHSSFSLLCAGFDGGQINLLQGPYPVAEKRKTGDRVWRSVAILAGCALMLHLALQIGQGVYFSRQAGAYQSETEALYQSVFPADRNVRDIKRRWNSHLGKSDNGGGTYISLLARSARGLEKAGLTLSNVNFNESRGDLILQVMAGQSDALVKYAQQLSNQGLAAEIGTITQEGTSVRGSIRVSEPGGAS